jgi:hypothetical protein
MCVRGETALVAGEGSIITQFQVVFNVSYPALRCLKQHVCFTRERTQLFSIEDFPGENHEDSTLTFFRCATFASTYHMCMRRFTRAPLSEGVCVCGCEWFVDEEEEIESNQR